MHKLESFAVSCGSKISKPFINKFFYPIKEKKFLSFSKAALTQSKQYDFFDDVIFHIEPYLSERNIEILEIGRPKEVRPAFYTKDYSHLNALQCSYLIDKSLMYFGNYNLYSNISSHFSKKIVCPSNIDYKSSFFPFWSSDKDCKIIMPKEQYKPSHSDKEIPKTINKINPEVVAASVLDLLKIKHNLSNINTVFMGAEYNASNLDIVPGDFTIPSPIQEPVNLRMDKNFDLSFLRQCSNLLQINLVTEKVINADLLKSFSDHIKSISFFVKAQTKISEIKELEKLGKPLNLLCRNSKKISDIRLRLIDYEIKHFQRQGKESLSTNNYDNLKFLSKRNILFEGQMYNSYISASLKKNISHVTDDKVFWEDLPFMRIFEEKKA